MKPLSRVYFFAIVLLAACSSVTERPASVFDLSQRGGLYGIRSWGFTGRLALISEQDSWSASIAWRHVPGKEQIELAGPLGQGAARIELTNSMVTIDKGGGDIQSSENPEAFISQQLGMPVPLRSMGYWVLGLVMPEQESQPMVDGFLQNGWYVDYRELQVVGLQTMPRKMTVMNDKVKLKLVIDNWKLNNAETTR